MKKYIICYNQESSEYQIVPADMPFNGMRAVKGLPEYDSIIDAKRAIDDLNRALLYRFFGVSR